MYCKFKCCETFNNVIKILFYLFSGWLASPKSNEEITFLNNYAPGYTTWIGYHLENFVFVMNKTCGSQTWKSVSPYITNIQLSQLFCSNGDQFLTNNFLEVIKCFYLEPNCFQNTENCAELRTGCINDNGCWKLLSYFCEYGKRLKKLTFELFQFVFSYRSQFQPLQQLQEPQQLPINCLLS